MSTRAAEAKSLINSWLAGISSEKMPTARFSLSATCIATFIAMSYIVVLNPLILGLGADSTGATLGVDRVAAMTALIGGVMTILMGVVAKTPFAVATGLGVNAFIAVTLATTPGLSWAQAMGLVIWAGVIMFVLVLTGFRTAVVLLFG